MLGVIRRAKYSNVAVAPEPATNGPAVRAQLLTNQLVGFVRTPFVKLAKRVNQKLAPAPHKYTPKVFNSLNAVWYPTNDLRVAIRAGAAIDFVNRDEQRELGFHLIGTGACCIDFPEREVTVRKAMFTSRHLPYGLAVVAAIITEATCSPVDFVHVAYALWQNFFFRTFGLTLPCTDPTDDMFRFLDFEKAETVVFAFTTRLIENVLVPALEKYKALENHRVLALCYRHWKLARDVKRILARFLRRMEAAMRTEVMMGVLQIDDMSLYYV